MNILYLHQYFCTPSMAGGTRSYELARRLVLQGHKVVMITTDRSPDSAHIYRWRESSESGIRVRWFGVPYDNAMGWPHRVKAFVIFAVAAAIELARHKADVLYASSTPLTISIPALFKRIVHGTPFVFEVRDLWPTVPIALGQLQSPLLRFAARLLERLTYFFSSSVVALSPDMHDSILRAGVPAAKVHVIANGCDVQEFAAKAVAPGCSEMPAFDVSQGPVVLYAGTFGHVNCLEYVIRLAAHMLNINTDVRFILLGDGKQRPFLESLAAALGVQNRNVFFYPAVPKERMPALLASCTMTISTVRPVPELWANSANKVFDSFAAGRPVAINHEGWLAKLIRERKCGLVLPADDLALAATKLVHFVTHDRLVNEAGNACQRLARTDFSRDRQATLLESILISATA